MKFSNAMRVCASIALVSAASMLAACSNSDGGAGSTSGSANFVLGPVTGAACTLASGSGNDPATYTTIVSSATTTAGSASFTNVPVSGAPLLMTCKGGTYTDETTGKLLTAATFRSWVVATAGNFTSTVTPLSELAVMLMDKNRKDTTKLKDGSLKNKGPKSPSEYKKAADQIAASFGLKGIDITTIKPTARGKGGTKLGTSAADKFTLALTALSQRGQKVVKTKSATLKSGSFKAIDCTTLDANTGTVDASCVLNEFFSGLGDDGSFNDPSVRGEFASALTDAAKGDPTLIDDSDLRDVYEESANADELPSIDYVDANSSTTQMDDSESLIIASGATSNITIVGQHLKLDPKLIVTLGGSACDLHDLEKTEAPEVDVEALIASGLSVEDAEAAASKAQEAVQDQLTADCPAKTDGDYPIMVTLKTDDGDEELFEDTITAKVKSAKLKSAAVKTKAFTCPMGATCTSTVSGTAIGIGPTIKLINGGTAAQLDYTTPKPFNIAGVVVELRDMNGALLDTSFTKSDGTYSFTGVQDGSTPTVRVNAQITNVSAAAKNGTTKYNFMVRDNTAANKDLFFVAQACAQTTGGTTTKCDVTAGLGTVVAGKLTDDAAGQVSRQSAPFSILTVVYSAASNLEAAYTGAGGDDLVMPDLNIYWSPKNINNSDGGKEGGGIDTSHYSGGGKLPGVFILGKASVDTDEFDTGVIGHEFGHYLQAVLSFSDNPGGSHGSAEFKDASLAYGEGYGTAIGGLLTNDPKYIDTAGADSIGGISDLSTPITAQNNPGFYSENAVAYVMYQIGNNAGGKYTGGFTALWKAVKAFKSNGDSATIFAFLSRYINQNPATITDVTALASTQNINTVDAKGVPDPAKPDPKVSAAASQGDAASGADDLEKQFATVSPFGPSTVAGTTAVATSDTFCVNRNLKGASNGNGLGMSRRFSFTPGFNGSVGLKPIDDKSKNFNEQQTSVSVRDATGAKAGIFVWDGGYGKITVVSGREYTVVVNANDPNGVFKGNVCGNKLALYQLAP